MRSRRLRKSRRSDPNASQSTLSIIGFITEFWQRAAGYVIDFKVGQSFGEAQAYFAAYSPRTYRHPARRDFGQLHLGSYELIARASQMG
jgi:hypothetical protein